jgi:hypothetical protein
MKPPPNPSEESANQQPSQNAAGVNYYKLLSATRTALAAAVGKTAAAELKTNPGKPLPLQVANWLAEQAQTKSI